MVDVAFEYKKLFKGAKQEEVFDAIQEWLRKKGATVKKAERPTLIETVYGRLDVEWNWHAEIMRTVDFELVSTKDYVGISVWQSRSRRTSRGATGWTRAGYMFRRSSRPFPWRPARQCGSPPRSPSPPRRPEEHRPRQSPQRGPHPRRQSLQWPHRLRRPRHRPPPRRKRNLPTRAPDLESAP
jgi:hypothetical protein